MHIMGNASPLGTMFYCINIAQIHAKDWQRGEDILYYTDSCGSSTAMSFERRNVWPQMFYHSVEIYNPSTFLPEPQSIPCKQSPHVLKCWTCGEKLSWPNFTYNNIKPITFFWKFGDVVYVINVKWNSLS